MRAREFIVEGIDHFEDLPLKEFIKLVNHIRKDMVKNPSKYELTEKVDGAAMGFGMDDKGKFYTDRAVKNGQVFYSDKEYPQDKFWSVGFRAAHKALEKIVQPFLHPGDRVNSEILFGELPNAVPYSKTNNQIIVLQATDGNPDIDGMVGLKATSQLDTIPVTKTGKEVSFEQSPVYKWSIDRTPHVPNDKMREVVSSDEFKTNLIELYKYLRSKNTTFPTLTNSQIAFIKFNTTPSFISKEEWKSIKEGLKAEKEKVEEHITNLKLGIKELLLNQLVRRISSKFGPTPAEGGWIEGVVMQIKGDSPLGKDAFVKLVDKGIFTAINQWNFIERTKVSNSRGDHLAGRVKIALANAANTPELGKPSIKAFVAASGNTPEERATKISQRIVDFNQTKQKFIDILEASLVELNTMYEQYMKDLPNLKKTFQSGSFNQTFSYEGEINERTKSVYAETFKRLRDNLRDVKNAKQPVDLITIMLGDKLE
jgi:hypothetical protein